jgi:5-hydroxyisourate hydrolase-like protein (transthyretin family)
MNRARRCAALLSAVLLAPCSAAFAAASGGISGFVIDEATKQPMPGVTVVIQRLPRTQSDKTQTTATNKKGFFSDLSLEPGQYAVTANVGGRKATCVVNEIYSGSVRRVKILVSPNDGDIECVGSNVHVQTIDPDEPASVYRVR